MNIPLLAKQLNVSRQTVYTWLKEGKIKTRRNFDGSDYVTKAEIARLRKERECSTQP